MFFSKNMPLLSPSGAGLEVDKGCVISPVGDGHNSPRFSSWHRVPVHSFANWNIDTCCSATIPDRDGVHPNAIWIQNKRQFVQKITVFYLKIDLEYKFNILKMSLNRIKDYNQLQSKVG